MLINFSTKLINFCRVQYFSTCKMNSVSCKVAVCQFTATNDKNNNLKIVKKLVGQAVEKNAKIVFLPEGCDYIGTTKDETKALAEPLSGSVMTEYKNLAKSNNIWLSVGGFHELVCGENDEPQYFNCHILIDSNGCIQSIYKKIHLFDVMIPEKFINLKESDVTQAGCQIMSPVNTPAGSVSLSICYDLRFPELNIMQRKLGATILTYPSAFTFATGLMHWEVLLKARAIESQCYVVAAAQYGKHNDKRISYGQSLVVDPWGKIIAECPKYIEGVDTNESIAVAEIDTELLKKVRSEMPVFQHRRSDIYQLKLIDNKKIPINDEETFMFADKVIPGTTVFYRTRYSYAFTNIRCVVSGHVLVASIRQAKRLENLTEEEVSDLFQTAVRVQSVMEKVNSSDSTTVCVQDGKHAGQTVPHVHVHILPRKPNDFDCNDDIYDRLAKHDRDNNVVPLRSIDEMTEEAKILRQYFR